MALLERAVGEQRRSTAAVQATAAEERRRAVVARGEAAEAAHRVERQLAEARYSGDAGEIQGRYREI